MRKIPRFRLEVQTDLFDLLDLLNRLMRLSPMIPEKNNMRAEKPIRNHISHLNCALSLTSHLIGIAWAPKMAELLMHIEAHLSIR